MFFEIFCQLACFSAARFTFRRPKTHVRNATNLRTFVFQTISMPFKRLFVLWHLLIRSLYFIQVYIFIPLIQSPHSCALFTHLSLHQFFSYVYYRAKYFSYLWWRCCSEFNFFFFNFSSQRPHLNIFLSNVYSFDTMEFSMKHKC